MKKIKFRYKDKMSHFEWRNQECVVESVEQCISIYGLGKDCEYEIISVEDTSTEITKERLKEYFYPTINFTRETDNVTVDYAEIEINPNGIKKLEENLHRYGNQTDWSPAEWQKLNDPENDAYEHVIAYVHFDAGTDEFNAIFIKVVTAYDADSLTVEALVNDEEKQNIIAAGLHSLKTWRLIENATKYWKEEE